MMKVGIVLIYFLDKQFNAQLPLSLGMALLTLIADVECGEPDGNSNALNGEAVVKEKLNIVTMEIEKLFLLVDHLIQFIFILYTWSRRRCCSSRFPWISRCIHVNWSDFRGLRMIVD